MKILPAAPTPLGQPTDADHARACDRLSTIHGRRITGGHAVEQLAVEYAQAYEAGYRAAVADAQRETAAVPVPRAPWQDAPVRGGLRR